MTALNLTKRFAYVDSEVKSSARKKHVETLGGLLFRQARQQFAADDDRRAGVFTLLSRQRECKRTEDQ
ncbi:hypothetical protein KIN20_004325 [Parelaphostrongylus tenuis]|uniref:Uncharacterized protein n=1 Tax=Parelaphostrongylus tenuis TaxID=148309 RepID=A0AAD5MJL8_PARTN|nr:hypothetical protein KIN20_004325 [Parelaphostrongylus tenuis]